MQDRRTARHRRQRGFALVLALLSLMLLTFLGLTLATTTSTELQIATNYRWSQQALYNAEAGLDAAKVVLSYMAHETDGWRLLLPTARPGSWPENSEPPPADPISGRDFERANCDHKAGVGLGRVLRDSGQMYENVNVFAGQALNGAFTVWIRRVLTTGNDGQFRDNTADNVLVIVSEGVAPYTGPADAFTRSRQATRVLETHFTLETLQAGAPCLGTLQGQEGGSPMGENFNPCSVITAGAGGTLANAFGGSGAGSLDAIPNVQ